MANVNEPHFDELREHPGFQARRARVGRQLGTERLGVSVWEVLPGQAAYPYHYHLAEEELVIVLDGAPSLRGPAGWSELKAGDVVSLQRGPDGAHQLVNRTERVVRFVAVSTHGDPDVVIYPDSGKLGAAERLPRGGGLNTMVRIAEAVDYYDGEEAPGTDSGG